MKITPATNAPAQTSAPPPNAKDDKAFTTALMTALLNSQQASGASTFGAAKLPLIRVGHSVLSSMAYQIPSGSAVAGAIGTSAAPKGVDLSSLDVDVAADAVVNTIGSNGTVSLDDVQKMYGFGDGLDSKKSRDLIAYDWKQLSHGADVMTGAQLREAIIRAQAAHKPNS